MTLTLVIANKRYSSWSMRPWVLLKALEIPFEESLQLFRPGQHQPSFLKLSPSGKLPCLYDDNSSIVVWDSLAICEYIAETHPVAWPTETTARAFARCAASEMHSGFNTIRDECSLNVGLRIELGVPSDGLQKDIDRLNNLFAEGIERFGGPFLAGARFSIADAMFAPVASRCKTYGIELEGKAARYLQTLFNHPAVQAWIQDGVKESEREPLHEENSLRGRRILEDVTKYYDPIPGQAV